MSSVFRPKLADKTNVFVPGKYAGVFFTHRSKQTFTLETLIQDRFIGVNNRVKMKLRLAHASFVITPFYYNMF